jgi:hypothetical protein
MTQADRVLSTPRTTAPESSLTTPELALHEQLKAAGMRLRRTGPDDYQIIWENQMVVSDLTLLQAAMFIDRALRSAVRS